MEKSQPITCAPPRSAPARITAGAFLPFPHPTSATSAPRMAHFLVTRNPRRRSKRGSACRAGASRRRRTRAGRFPARRRESRLGLGSSAFFFFFRSFRSFNAVVRRPEAVSFSIVALLDRVSLGRSSGGHGGAARPRLRARLDARHAIRRYRERRRRRRSILLGLGSLRARDTRVRARRVRLGPSAASSARRSARLFSPPSSREPWRASERRERRRLRNRLRNRLRYLNGTSFSRLAATASSRARRLASAAATSSGRARRARPRPSGPPGRSPASGVFAVARARAAR